VLGIVPIRSFRDGMRRLAGTLDTDSRYELGRSLADRVVTAAVAGGLVPLVVSGDPDVVSWATGSGFASIPDPGGGLDAACEAGVGWATASGVRWVVLHADLPLLDAGDIRALSEPIESGRDVIAPSWDGGTSALSATRPITPSFGASSFHRHLRRLIDPVVVARTGLLHDVDSSEDLTAAAAHPRGAWLRGMA
jgi:2-phospho-L-lactate guanylyltransferase